jgi:TolB-like protein
MTGFGPGTFIRELRRRRVFSLVALYAAAAWVVVEVGDLVIDSGMITGLTTRNLLTLAIIGFPLTLVAGWFYDITKHGIVRTAPAGADDSFDESLRPRDYALFVLLLAIWSSAYVYLHSPPPIDKSIAVLPFENRGNDPENAHFAFGIHDDLMTRLQRVRDLTLIAQSSVSQIDRETPLEIVASKLGVAYVMKGTVERVLDRIRVNVVLIEAAEARQTWSGSFDRELSAVNLFDIRDDISRAITNQLQAALSPSESSRVFGGLPTSNMQAYQLYLRARQLFEKRLGEASEEALSLYRQAVELDPEFALAWVGIADTALHLLVGDFIGYGEADEIASKAVERALALDDQLGEAWVPQAIVYRMHEQQDKARDACEKALDLSPTYAHAHHWCMDILDEGTEYDPERQLAKLYRITALDPLAARHQLNVAIKLGELGRYEEAAAQFEFVMQTHPDFSHTYRRYAFMQADLGELASAVRLTRRSLQENPGHLGTMFNLFSAYRMISEFELMAGMIDRILEHRLIQEDPGYVGADFWTVMLNMQVDFARGNPGAAIGRFDAFDYQEGGLHNWYAWAQLASGNMAKARESWFRFDVRHIDVEDTDALIRNGLGCITAGLMMATGDEERGREMLERARYHFEEFLPQKVLDPDRESDLWVCYLLEGLNDKALEYYEQRVEHGHIGDWWRDRQLPWWNPLRDGRRFQALDERILRLIAEQQELLRQDADGEL